MNIGVLGRIILTILGLGFLIFIHELGHFWVAKILHIRVYELVLGYGPKLFSFTLGETVYGVAAVPLGGYVRLEDIKPEDISLREERLPVLGDQPLWKRICVLFGGPFMNFLIPVFLIAIIFMLGVPSLTTTVEGVISGYPAAEAGFKKGDKIISVEGNKIETWDKVTEIIKENPNKTLKFTVQRSDNKVTIDVKTAEKDGAGFLGVAARADIKKFGIFSAFYQGFKVTLESIWITLKFLFLIIVGKIPEGLNAKVIGPVGLVKEISVGIQEGLMVYLGILAQMSIGLGIANLIPIPPLDGGKLAFIGYEFIAKKPLKIKTMLVLQSIGIALLVFLMVMVTFSDIFGFFVMGG